MINSLINPPGIEDEYLTCLNSCFPGWGDRRSFDWYFRRPPHADLIVFQKNGRIAAGSAVTYRRLMLPNGKLVTAGIMTGSWTLPDFRRQGFFARTIQESVKLASQRGAALLLAFVTQDNASFRRLENAGAALVPTWYLFSTRETQPVEETARFAPVEKNQRIVRLIFDQLQQATQSQCRFAYSSPAELESQFLDRPSGITQIFHAEDGCLAIVENKQSVEQMQLLAGSRSISTSLRLGWFLNRAMQNKRQFFMFSSDRAVANAAWEIGLQSKAGHVTVLVANGRELAAALGALGEPPLSAIALGLPETPWFIGPWSIAGGERA